MSDVPRSLQSWVSTIHTVVLTADVFQLFIKKANGKTRPILFSDIKTRIRSLESDRFRNILSQTTGPMRCRLIININRMLAELQVIITVMATRSHVFVLVGPWRLSLVLPSAPWQEPKVRVWPASFSSFLPQIFLSFLAVCEQFCPSRRIESDDPTYGPL